VCPRENRGESPDPAHLTTPDVAHALPGVAQQKAVLMGVRMLATAGTGAAISGLSGVVCQSATIGLAR
jgi:hypothetical protein